MLTYLEDEFDERWEFSRQAGETNYCWDGIQETEILPKWLGQGQCQFFNFPNLLIDISQETYTEPFKIVRHHETKFNLVSKFYLSGQLQVKTEGIANEYTEVEGHNYLYCLPDANEVETHQSDKSTDIILIEITPDYLKTFVESQLQELVPELQQYVSSKTRPFFHRSLGKNTAAMQVALHQIVNCPYRGLVRNMFLESRATELLALQFKQWNLMKSATPAKQSKSFRRTSNNSNHSPRNN